MPIRKSLETYLMILVYICVHTRIYIYIYIYIYIIEWRWSAKLLVSFSRHTSLSYITRSWSARCILTSLSVNVILLLSYSNCSTNLRSFLLRVETISSCLKHIHSILFKLTKKPGYIGTFSNRFSMNSGWDGVCARSAR